MIHTLTRESDVSGLGPNVHAGRVNLNLLRKVLPDAAACHFFLCGPAITPWDRLEAREKGVQPQPRFFEAVLADLESLGVARERIRREAYG